MHNLKMILIMIFAVGLISCTLWKKYGFHGESQQAAEIKPFQIPPDLTATQMEEYYPVPQRKRANPHSKEYYSIPEVVHDNMKNSVENN